MGLISSIAPAVDLDSLASQGALVDLRVRGVIADDATKNTDNIGIINDLIQTYKGLGKPLVMLLPEGSTYIDKDGTNSSILFDEGCQDMAIIGRGRFVSKLIQHGEGTGNDWSGVVIDRGKRIALADFTMEQGEIQIPSTGQHDHLIQVANYGSGGDRCEQIYGSRLGLGKCLGDCINFVGNTLPIYDIAFDDLAIDAAGFVLKTWQPLHAYAFGSMVRIGSLCYYATTGGTSSSTEPSTTGAGIVDGTVVWSTVVCGATYRFAARSGLAFQRNHVNVRINNFNIKGIQNSGIDMEATSAGTMRSVRFSKGYIDNTDGNTSTCFSFSGSNTLSDQTNYSGIEDVTLLNGSMQIAETRNCRISRVTIVQDEAPAADTNVACLYVMRGNEGLVIESCNLHRLGTSQAGELLNIQGTGKVTLAGAWILEQTTAADLIGADCESDLRFDGSFSWSYSGSSPSTKAVVNINALNHDCDRPIVRGFRGESTSGAMKAFAVMSTRAAKALLDLAPLTANCETVVRAKNVGTGGNSITLAFVADGSGTGSLTQSGSALTFHYESGVTTVANFETAVGASALIEVATVDGVGTLTSPGDTFAATALAGGNSRSMRDVVIADNHAKPGSVLTGVYFSKQVGSILDDNPIMQGNDFGDGTLYTQVDIGDNPIDDAVFPLVDGNKQGMYHLIGTVTPTANVRAPQGTRYTWLNGDSTKWYVKASGTNKGGWKEITGLGAASFAPYEMPITSADWTTFLADNVLDADWDEPDLSFDCQEASGDLTPSIGAIDLVAAGTPTYQNDESAAGYTADDSIGFQDNEADAFASTSASLPDPSNTSYLSITVGRITAVPAAARSWLQLSPNNAVRMTNDGGSNARVRIFYVGNDITPAVNLNVTDFRIWIEQVNETANTALFGNEDFKAEPGYVSASSATKYLGVGAVSGDPQAAPFRMLRKYVWFGTKAERTKAQIKTLLEAMGAGVVWTP